MLHKSYMMKLDWHLMVQPNKLCVKIMKVKYSCSSFIILLVLRHSNSSSTWKTIFNVWDDIKENITQIIQDGHDTEFWKDSWIRGCSSLHSQLSRVAPGDESNFSLFHYSSIGVWNWDSIGRYVPSDICKKIAAIKPPYLRTQDFP